MSYPVTRSSDYFALTQGGSSQQPARPYTEIMSNTQEIWRAMEDAWAQRNIPELLRLGNLYQRLQTELEGFGSWLYKQEPYTIPYNYEKLPLMDAHRQMPPLDPNIRPEYQSPQRRLAWDMLRAPPPDASRQARQTLDRMNLSPELQGLRDYLPAP
jgi:hypothetical protein